MLEKQLRRLLIAKRSVSQDYFLQFLGDFSILKKGDVSSLQDSVYGIRGHSHI